MNNNRLHMRFALLAADYIEAFTAKQKLDFDGWVGDDVGGIATFGDFFFNFDDIRYDIDHSVKKGFIIRWYDADFLHNQERDEPQHINFSSYCKGLRHKDLGKKKRFTKKKKQEHEVLWAKIEGLKDEIKEMWKPRNVKDVMVDDCSTVPMMDNLFFCMKCNKITEHRYAVCTECNS